LFGTTGNAFIADAVGVGSALYGDPKNAIQTLSAVGGDIYKGLSMGKSGFDSGGLATVTQITTAGNTFDGSSGVEKQADPPLASKYLPSKLSR